MSEMQKGVLVRIVISLAVMWITHMPFWGAVILYAILDVGFALSVFGTYMIAWTLAIQDRIEADERTEEGVHLAVVPDDESA